MCVFYDRLLIPLFVHFISGMMTMQKFVDFKHNLTFGEIKYLPQHFAFGFSKELIHWWVHVSNSWIGLPCSYMDVSPSNQILLKCLKKNWKRKISEADGYILSLILWHLHLGTERIDLTELVPPVWKEKDFAESIQQWRKKLLEIGFF